MEGAREREKFRKLPFQNEAGRKE